MDHKKYLVILNLLVIMTAIACLISPTMWEPQHFLLRLGALLVFGCSILNSFLLRHVETTPAVPISLLESTTELTIHDVEGKNARATKWQRLKVNAPGIRNIIDQGLWADGVIKVTKAEFGDLNVIAEPTIIRPEDKIHELQFKFTTDMPIKGQTYERRLELEYENSFLNAKEYFTVRISRHTKHLSLVINVPRERPIKDSWLHYRDEYTVSESKPPDLRIQKIDGVCTRLRYDIRKPKLGSSHQVWWEW